MAAVRRSDARPGRTLAGLTLLAVVLAAVVLPHGTSAAGHPASGLVPPVVAAYGQVGTLAVALAHQRLPGDPPSMGSRGHRTAGFIAHNGAADRPFPAASMVKLYMAEDILHRNRARSRAVVVAWPHWPRTAGGAVPVRPYRAATSMTIRTPS